MPSATIASRASSPGAVAGILGVAAGAIAPCHARLVEDGRAVGIRLRGALDGDEALAPAAAFVERQEPLADASHEAALDELGDRLVVAALSEAGPDDGQDLVRRARHQVAPIGGIRGASHGPVLEREVDLGEGRVVDPEARPSRCTDPLEVVKLHRGRG